MALLCFSAVATPPAYASARHRPAQANYARLNHELRGRLYLKVRSELIRRGYRLVRLRPPVENTYCYGDFCKRFPEAANCTGGGMMYCDFIFLDRSGRLMDVATKGEGVISVVDVRPPDDWTMQEIRSRRLRGDGVR